MHPIPVVSDLLPIRWRFLFQEWTDGNALHVARDPHVGEVTEGRCEVDVGDYVFADGSCLYDVRESDEEGHLEGLFVHEALVEPAMLT